MLDGMMQWAVMIEKNGSSIIAELDDHCRIPGVWDMMGSVVCKVCFATYLAWGPQMDMCAEISGGRANGRSYTCATHRGQWSL